MPDVDPDKILKEMDAQLLRLRASRRKPLEEKNGDRIKVLVVFCVVLIMALWVLQLVLSQMLPSRNRPAANPQPGAQDGKR